MQAVEGVDFVNVTVFDSVAEDTTVSALASLGTTLLLRSQIAAKPAYVDTTMKLPASPTAQDYFQIRPTELVYLTPNIADTLILTEITPTNPGPQPLLRSQIARARLRSRG
jgi:hypothetical protein